MERSNFKNFNYIHDIGTTAVANLDAQLIDTLIAISIMFAWQNNGISIGLLAGNAFFGHLFFFCLPIFSISPALVSQTCA